MSSAQRETERRLSRLRLIPVYVGFMLLAQPHLNHTSHLFAQCSRQTSTVSRHVTAMLCWCRSVSVFASNRDTAVPAEGNGDLQTLICVLLVRLRRCPTLSNPVLWQSWMVAYPGCTLQMKTLFPGWPS